MNTNEVGHAWIHRTDNNATGQNGGYGQFYFEGDTIYSYGTHFPIAKHFEKENIILFTTLTASNTTAGHIAITLQAIPNYLTTLFVENPTASTKNEHKTNYKNGVARIKTLKNSLVRTRKNSNNQLSILNEIENITNNLNQYTKIFKLGFRQLTAFVLTNDLKQQLFDQDKKEQQVIKNKNRKQIRQWLNNEKTTMPYSIDETFCRISKDGERIETSKGAFFPTSHAKLIWRMIERCRKTKTSWTKDKVPMRAGVYTVDKIDQRGDLKAGCHLVRYENMLPVAQQLELV